MTAIQQKPVSMVTLSLTVILILLYRIQINVNVFQEPTGVLVKRVLVHAYTNYSPDSVIRPADIHVECSRLNVIPVMLPACVNVKW